MAREAEVENLHAPVADQKQVVRLQIPVDDLFVVGSGEPARDLHGHVERLAHGHGTGLQPGGERLAFEELGDDEHLAVVSAGVMNGEDVRVRERGDRLRLAFEARAPFGIAGEACGQDLDGDVTVEPRVVRAVDLAHPAGADGGDDLVRSEGCAGG